MQYLRGIRFYEGVESIREVPGDVQVDVLEAFFSGDSYHYLHQMLGSVCDNDGSVEAEKRKAEICDALVLAFWRAKSHNGDEREKQFAELGRLIVNHAWRYATAEIDAYIEDNIDALISASI